MSDRSKLMLTGSIVLGILAILATLTFLSSVLFSIIDPFTTSIIVEVVITSIIVGSAWWIHAKLLKQ
jgi:hypothetical protein